MLKIFAIKDLRADAFFPPFFTTNRATAERDFRRLLGDPNSKLHHDPADFVLYEIGNWNEEVGVIVSRDVPDLVIRADSIRNLAAEEN